tara:strand:+ start:1413 stop:1946 length:534 start_codon:yes stop_codon:yes gene_type:complete
MAIPFDPATATQKKEFTPIPDGKYFGHIVEFNEPKTDVETKRGAICDILKLVFEIDGEKHPDLSKRKIWVDVWITKEVKGEAPDSSENLRFYKFLESVDYPLDEEEMEIGGITKMVKLLPQGATEIYETYLVKKPLMVTTYTDEWTGDDGEKRSSAKVRYFEAWKDGKEIEVDDLPF